MLTAFLVAFPALFGIVNPIARAPIFRQATAGRTHAERVTLAKWVGLYALIVLIVALWFGTYLLAFFGITVAALRIAGGLILTLFAWELLGEPEKRKEQKQEQVANTDAGEDTAFFPLTLPFTAGPGTIAGAVAIGSGRPDTGAVWFFAGVTLAAVLLAATVTITYAYADRLADRLGGNGSRTVTRLSAFLLFCIGIQLLISGVVDVLGPLLAAAGKPA